ncbi:MAG: precorrin-6A/cobalt-precorrin-6A reductase [Silicimonas sp.]
MRVLLLAGAGEARHIALALWREPRLSVTVSLARAGRRPQSYAWPVRIGGWGGEDAFREWVASEGFVGIIDATHPYATAMAARCARVAADLGIDHIRFLRPSWVPQPRDRWIFLNGEDEAADHIPPEATVFLGTGRRGLEHFRNLDGRRVFCRVAYWPVGDFPLGDGDFFFDPGPYTVPAERRLFTRLGVDWLIARNSGGADSWPKIEAARELGMPVAMVRRPPQPEVPRVTTVAEALAWVRRRV